jgi:hypothetical protein
MAKQNQMRRLSPGKGAAGQIDVNFEHERRGSSSPSEMMEYRATNQPFTVPTKQPAKPLPRAK